MAPTRRVEAELPASIFILALVAAASFLEPLTPEETAAWRRGAGVAPDALVRLRAFNTASELEGAGELTAALAALESHQQGDDPLAIAIRFHRERLALRLGRRPGQDLWLLFAGPTRRSPALRWGITREQETKALSLLAARLDRLGKQRESAAIRRHLAIEYPRWTTAPADLPRADRRRRATRLIRDMDYKGGERALRALLADAPAKEVVPLQRELGELIAEKMRDDYPAAAGIFRRIVADPASRAEDHLYLAYLLGKFDAPASVATYRAFLARFAEHAERDKAAFFIAWDAFDQEAFPAAVEGLSAFIRDYPASAYRDAAHWYRGLAHYRLGRWTEALPDLERTAAQGRERDKGEYWTARVLQQLGRPADAEKRLVALAARAPLSFYGALARSRLAADRRPPVWSPTPEGLAKASGGLSAAASSAFAALAPARRRLVLEALAAAQVGELDLSRRLLRHLEGLGLDGNLRDVLRPRLADFRRSVFSQPAKSCRRALRSDPREPTVGACWRWLYPLAYRSLIEAVRGEVPAELFWAIMRQESLYDPEARSSADALGLLQLIPQVGGPAAAALELPFAPYRLTRPRLHLTLFAQHARASLKRFGGHLPLFLIAYNGSPEMAEIWLKANGELPFDLFVEEISYKETRDYVKRVSSHLAHYRASTRGSGSEDDPLAWAGLPHPDTPAAEAFGAGR